ncbi:ZIP family metal transporter [Legionella septentrionalis]|uniref:ZIP family metal transporter n=1 Tax=Legionella septentrionalis TaxID=2498109 RepID=UPI001F1BBE3F|nr:ZIP family metal transporter [Legionella septentrionalis]
MYKQVGNLQGFFVIWISKIHLLVAFLSTLILVLFHYLSPWFARHLPGNGKAFISFAGGTAIAYVFLHMLPNLVEYNEPMGKFLIQSHWLTPFSELMIYLVALAGFLIYYGMELAAERSKYLQTRGLVYALHLFMFCLYNFLITYTMSLRAQVSLSATALFTFSMALNFVLTDKKFSRLHATEFNHVGRFILILFLLLGWLCSVIFEPVNAVVVAFMVAFLAGSVLLNVFREELPGGELVSYCWLVCGVFLVSFILLLQIGLLKSS